MLHHPRRGVRKALGFRFIDVIQDTPEMLHLRYGGTETVLDRAGARILQNGKLVAMIDLVENVELHQPPNQDGPRNWFVTVHVRGARQVEVGRVTDSTDASIIAARVATAVSRPVVLHKR